MRRAAAEDNWSESLRDHVETCLHCRAASAVAPLMTNIAQINEREHALPQPAVIWLKAQLLGGTAAVNRVSRPLNMMQIVAYVVVAGCWASMLMSKWSAITNLVNIRQGIATGSTISLSLLSIIAILGSITFALAMHTILSEE